MLEVLPTPTSFQDLLLSFILHRGLLHQIPPKEKIALKKGRLKTIDLIFSTEFTQNDFL